MSDPTSPLASSRKAKLFRPKHWYSRRFSLIGSQLIGYGLAGTHLSLTTALSLTMFCDRHHASLPGVPHLCRLPAVAAERAAFRHAAPWQVGRLAKETPAFLLGYVCLLDSIESLLTVEQLCRHFRVGMGPRVHRPVRRAAPG
jgi:hypothetical protein